jgi:hypothetical protein
MARFFWWARNWLGICLSSCGGLDRTPQERKRLLGPGDNLPGAFHFVELDEPMRVSEIRTGARSRTKGCRSRRLGAHSAKIASAWAADYVQLIVMPLRELSAPPPLLAEPHLLGEVRTSRCIVRRHHRIVGRQSPFLAVLLRRHVVLRAQMTLE